MWAELSGARLARTLAQTRQKQKKNPPGLPPTPLWMTALSPSQGLPALEVLTARRLPAAPGSARCPRCGHPLSPR